MVFEPRMTTVFLPLLLLGEVVAPDSAPGLLAGQPNSKTQSGSKAR